MHGQLTSRGGGGAGAARAGGAPAAASAAATRSARRWPLQPPRRPLWTARKRSGSTAAASDTTTPSAAAQQESDLRRRNVLNFSREFDGGALRIVPLRAQHIGAAADLLASSFVEAKGVEPYRRFVRRNIVAYLEARLALPPRALVLVALQMPPLASADDAPAPVAPPPPAVVGSAEVSLDAATRSAYLTLNPPPSASYLCNMAVLPSSRRARIGSRLLAAAEAVAADAGSTEMCLHLRLKDDDEGRLAAGALYRSAGFTPAKTDGWWVKLFGVDPRHLMVKRLQPAGRGG